MKKIKNMDLYLGFCQPSPPMVANHRWHPLLPPTTANHHCTDATHHGGLQRWVVAVGCISGWWGWWVVAVDGASDWQWSGGWQWWKNFNFLWVGSDPNMDKSIFLTLPLTLSSDPSIYNTKGVMCHVEWFFKSAMCWLNWKWSAFILWKAFAFCHVSLPCSLKQLKVVKFRMPDS